MSVKLKKLDRRMKGYGDFKYVAKLRRRSQSKEFKEIRNWCWEQWGPSAELDLWDGDNPAWCWSVEEFELRIYLAEDQQASWFTLKWS